MKKETNKEKYIACIQAIQKNTNEAKSIYDEMVATQKETINKKEREEMSWELGSCGAVIVQVKCPIAQIGFNTRFGDSILILGMQAFDVLLREKKRMIELN